MIVHAHSKTYGTLKLIIDYPDQPTNLTLPVMHVRLDLVPQGSLKNMWSGFRVKYGWRGYENLADGRNTLIRKA